MGEITTPLSTLNGKASTFDARSRPDFARTDLGNAEIFVAHHGDRFRHVRERRRWHVWDNGRWREDLTGAAERGAKDVARLLLLTAAEMVPGEEQKGLA